MINLILEIHFLMVESFPSFIMLWIHWNGFMVWGIYHRGSHCQMFWFLKGFIVWWNWPERFTLSDVLFHEGFYSVVKLTRKVHIVRCSGSWRFYCIMCFTGRWSPEGGSLEWRRSPSACPEEFTARTMSRGQKVIHQAHSPVTVTQGFF